MLHEEGLGTNADELYDVAEVFDSVQGEGPHIGRPCTFVRLAGCNLRCEWCDSKYALDPGTPMTTTDILKRIPLLKHVVITGGEPTLQPLKPLILALFMRGNSVEVETNGTTFDPWLRGYAEVNVSPKFQALHWDILEKWAGLANFKFVIEDDEDIERAHDVAKRVGASDVYLMPQGTTAYEVLNKMRRIAEYLVERHPTWPVRIAPRLHILLWDNERGR